jgi:transcriptional regulator with PAS, ATPase and Fis domain
MEEVMAEKQDRRSEPRLRTQQTIAARYGKPWREVIRLLYEYHDSMETVGSTLGVSKPTLYRWISKIQWAEWKQQNRAALTQYLKNPARALLDDE